MAVRITAAEVRDIMDATVLTDPIIGTYILGANTLINSVLGIGITDILKEIERWLTAHLIAISRERMAKKEEAGGAKIEYIGDYGAGLDSTPYGQMVQILDTTGAMATLMMKKATTYAVTEDQYRYLKWVS